MNIISRTTASAALILLAGCSVFQPAQTQQGCPAADLTTCPVCPEPETLHCPQPEVVERIVTVTPPAPPVIPAPKPKTAGKLKLPVVGAVEWATVEPGDILLEARIDTGTETTSLSAQDIELLEKDGKRWVHFALLDPKTGEKVELEQRLRKKIRIKQSSGEVETRYVVQLWITIGKTRSLVDVTLADRGHMKYPLAIGRNMLVDTMIVDVSEHHTTRSSGKSSQ